MLNKKILFRLDFGGKIGFGHLRRCQALAEILSRDKWISIFFIKNFNNNNFREKIPYKHYIVKKNIKLVDEIKLINNIIKKSKINLLFCDLENFSYLKLKKKYSNLLNKVSSGVKKISWDNNFKKKFNFRYYYLPYFDQKKKKNQIFTSHKCIPIISRFYYKKRKIKKNVKNIFINLGGAFKNNEVFLILNEIEKNNFKYNITFVSSKKIKFFSKKFKNIRLKVIFLKKYEQIINLLKKADVGVFYSGYSKYEAIASRLPSIILEKNRFQKKYNLPLKRRKLILTSRINNINNSLKLLNENRRNLISKQCAKFFKIENERFIQKQFNRIKI